MLQCVLSVKALQGVDDLRIELLARVLDNLSDRLFDRLRRPIRTIVRHCIERVGNGDDRGRLRDIVASQAIEVRAYPNPSDEHSQGHEYARELALLTASVGINSERVSAGG